MNILRSRLTAGAIGGLVLLAGGTVAASATESGRNDAAAAGVTGYVIVNGPWVSAPPDGGIFSAVAQCPRGKVAVGGGFNTWGEVIIVQSFTDRPGGLSRWQIVGEAEEDGDSQLQATAVCVDGG